MGYVLATLLIFFALFMLLTHYCGQGKPIDELKVTSPPAMNTMEQFLAVQNAISQAEEPIQDGNIVFLKSRALQLSIFPQVLFGLFFVVPNIFVFEESNNHNHQYFTRSIQNCIHNHQYLTRLKS